MCSAMSLSVDPAADRPRLAVVFGGRSSEHGVSCLTAREVLAAIDTELYDVRPIGVTRDGAWVQETAVWPELEPGTLPAVRDDMPPFTWEELRSFDAVFPLLHGPWGEDGTIQGLFEMADVRYVGAGVLSSAVSMDKPFTKTVFSAAGLPQIPYVTVLPWQWREQRDKVEARVRALGLPVFVKPARAGSSSGVMMVDSWDELDEAIDKARDFDPKVIVEAVVRGRFRLGWGVVQRPGGKPLGTVSGGITDAPWTNMDFY